MVRRDTERHHAYSSEIFSKLKIFDIQGLLKEEDEFKCGIEAYQVKEFSLITNKTQVFNRKPSFAR